MLWGSIGMHRSEGLCQGLRVLVLTFENLGCTSILIQVGTWGVGLQCSFGVQGARFLGVLVSGSIPSAPNKGE